MSRPTVISFGTAIKLIEIVYNILKKLDLGNCNILGTKGLTPDLSAHLVNF